MQCSSGLHIGHQIRFRDYRHRRRVLGSWVCPSSDDAVAKTNMEKRLRGRGDEFEGNTACHPWMLLFLFVRMPRCSVPVM